jgi:tetratricopeptide (TPR) repeat protein
MTRWSLTALRQVRISKSASRVLKEEGAMPEDQGSAEEQAAYFLNQGSRAEQEQRYDAAIAHYREGLTFKPTDKFVAYFLHNNLGYCLNLRGEHVEAEHLCRLAIEINSTWANAFKNLGISLAGQNDLVGAAWAWIEGTRADARDSRALHLLEKLIVDHPELTSQFPGVLKELEECKKAVKAEQIVPIHLFEICQLKYVPGKGFVESKANTERDISADEVERLYTEEAISMVSEHPYTWCSIMGIDKTRKSPWKVVQDSSQAPRFKSRSEFLAWRRTLRPSLILKDHVIDGRAEN